MLISLALLLAVLAGPARYTLPLWYPDEQPVPEEAGEFFQQPKASVDTGPVKVSLEQLQSGGFYPFHAVFGICTARIPGLDQNFWPQASCT